MAVSRRSYLAAKRMLDIVLGVVLLVLSLPFMLLIAIAIGLGSRGPVLFLQPRVGKAGKVFPLAKFRTMKAGNDDSIHREYYEQLVRGTAEPRVNSRGEPVYLLDDPRITRVGRFLRRTSLDELPNLFNVLAGQMSLVGPRPAIEYEVALYDDRARCRLDVKPGMTGLAQVRGRGSLDFSDMIDFDIEYVESRSMAFDLKILLATPLAVLTRRGV